MWKYIKKTDYNVQYLGIETYYFNIKAEIAFVGEASNKQKKKASACRNENH